jgi:hypothetical protein
MKENYIISNFIINTFYLMLSEQHNKWRCSMGDGNLKAFEVSCRSARGKDCSGVVVDIAG